MAFQEWSNTQRSPLLAYHGKVGLETAEENERFNLYAELGYHQRGSALRNARFRDFNSGNLFDLPTQKYLFHNISLAVGARSKSSISPYSYLFYGIALRGEYTYDTNLDEYRGIVDDFYGGVPVFPIEEFVRKWLYGVDITGGFEYDFDEYMDAIFEIRLSPDFATQYQQPAVNNVVSPFPGQSNLRELRIVNVSLEVSVGIRFLRKIEYID